MYRIDDATAATSLPAPEAAAAEGYFTEGNPATGTPATKVRASWLNMLQEELRAVVVGAAMTPSKTTYNQVFSAIQSLIKAAAQGISSTSSISTTAKISATNAPNLLFNGSGEFGVSGWVMAPGPAFSQQVDQTGGIGSFFANTSTMSNASGYIGSPLVQIGQNAAVTESIDVANFATAGTLVLTLAAYNSGGTFISNVASLTVPNGTPLQRYTLTGTTPAGTASVQAYWTYTGVSASPFGIAIRRLKIEQGATASLYSQEASIATLAGGMPVVGTARNVAMNVASASSTATLTADEVIVCTGLGLSLIHI